MQDDTSPKEQIQEDDVQEDEYRPMSSDEEPIVLGEISSGLIRQWIMEARYKREQERAQEE